MKKRLIIVSDIWGIEKSKWLSNYTQILKTNYDVVIYDSCELGEIDKSNYTEENLHKQFVNGGIETAVENLIKLEKDKVNVLAFSVGGSIAWKFGLKSCNIESLICVSSTRLRYETIKPVGKIALYFGAIDMYKPNTEWFESMGIDKVLIKDKGHKVYSDHNFIDKIINKMELFFKKPRG